MNTFKIALFATVATLAFAGTSFAQNFQGFGAPGYVTDQAYTATQQNRQVSLQSHKAKVAKHHHVAK